MTNNLTLEDIFKYIQNIKEQNNIQINKKKLSPMDNMIAKCFKLFKNDDIIKIYKINICVEYLQNTDFLNNYNKMILLSIMNALIDEFRELSIIQQMNNINNYINAIITIIKSRNGSSKRFFDPNMKAQARTFKQNIIYKDDYSNYMINFYANYLNVNIFIIENDCKVMLYTMNKLFNENKPSIILWHFEDKTYLPITINDKFIFYKDINEFNNFLTNNTIGVYNVLTMKNDSPIKDITIKNEDLLKYGYDDDLKIIYEYLTLPVIKRTSKKSKIYSSSISLTTEELNNDEELNNEELNNKKINNDEKLNNNEELNNNEKLNNNEELNNNENIIEEIKENNIEENNNEEEIKEYKFKKDIDLSTEQAVNNVILESYDEKYLKTLKLAQLQELLIKQNISIYTDDTNKKKKTRVQIIKELKN